MEKQTITNAREVAKQTLLDALYSFVRENGDECTEYETVAFGLESGTKKVLNFLDNGGCSFYEPSKGVNDPTCEDIAEDVYEVLYRGVTFTSYQCLYIDADDTLKYFYYTNGGITFDADQADAEHGYVAQLPLNDLAYLVEAVTRMA